MIYIYGRHKSEGCWYHDQEASPCKHICMWYSDYMSCWSLGMDKSFHSTRYDNHLSMQGLALIHVSKRGLRMASFSRRLRLSVGRGDLKQPHRTIQKILHMVFADWKLCEHHTSCLPIGCSSPAPTALTIPVVKYHITNTYIHWSNASPCDSQIQIQMFIGVTMQGLQVWPMNRYNTKSTHKHIQYTITHNKLLQ